MNTELTVYSHLRGRERTVSSYNSCELVKLGIRDPLLIEPNSDKMNKTGYGWLLELVAVT